MKSTTGWIAGIAICILVLSAGQAPATSGWKNSWKSQYPDAAPLLVDAANDCTLCHLSNTYNPRNPYGATLETMSFVEAEAVDSDNDTVINGHEIEWGTLPGDAASAEEAGSWGSIKALFRVD